MIGHALGGVAVTRDNTRASDGRRRDPIRAMVFIGEKLTGGAG
jgi:hypothetical protein